LGNFEGGRKEFSDNWKTAVDSSDHLENEARSTKEVIGDFAVFLMGADCEVSSIQPSRKLGSRG
jgi:hypothetical protein